MNLKKEIECTWCITEHMRDVLFVLGTKRGLGHFDSNDLLTKVYNACLGYVQPALCFCSSASLQCKYVVSPVTILSISALKPGLHLHVKQPAL